MTSWPGVLGFDAMMVGVVVVVVRMIGGAAAQWEMRMTAAHHGSQFLLL